jgi:predicted DNA-binding transcriptional regulator AlpA
MLSASKPTIIFCPHEKATEISDALSIPILLFSQDFKTVLNRLEEGGAIIVTDKYGLSVGWTAPDNAVVIFIEGFPTEGPVRAQAEGRFRRTNTPEGPTLTPSTIRRLLGGISSGQFWYIKENQDPRYTPFPKSVFKFGRSRWRWRESEIRAWMKANKFAGA